MNRVTPIDARMLERFEQGYAARPELNVMSNAVSRTALPDAAFVPAAAAKLRMDFSVLVKTNNITNQKQRISPSLPPIWRSTISWKRQISSLRTSSTLRIRT